MLIWVCLAGVRGGSYRIVMRPIIALSIVALLMSTMHQATASIPNQAVAASTHQATTASTVRILTYNIQFGHGGLDDVIKTVRGAAPDVVALEEVDRRTERASGVDQLKRLEEALGMRGVFSAHNHTPDAKGGETGTALFSRFDIRDFRKHPSIPGSPLTFLSASLRTPNGSLHILVVHLYPTHPFESRELKKRHDEVRLREAQRVAAFARSLGEPVVILGDFNDTARSRPYQEFASTFQDACKVAGGLLENTWPASIPITRIDYVFASPRLAIQRCQTLRSYASDHRPVLTELLSSY